MVIFYTPPFLFPWTKKKQKVKAKDQLQSFSRAKVCAYAAEKIVVHTLSPKQPHYYQRMIEVKKKFNVFETYFS